MLEKRFRDITLRELMWYFLIYAFLGWLWEQTFVFVVYGALEKRGFLYGPYGPIYGFGVLIVIFALKPIKNRVAVLFLVAVILTTAFEYLTGYALDVLFNRQWWDYTGVPFTLNGHINLGVSLIWGLGCLYIIKVFHPRVEAYVEKINGRKSRIILISILSIFIVDNVVTIIGLLIR